MLLYKVASFVVIDFENGVDYISFSVFDFSALKNGTEYSFVNDQFQVNDYTDVTFIFDKNGNPYTEATLDYFIETIKVIADPNIGNLPAGGTAGQILSKIDSTDYNAQWIDNLLRELKDVNIVSAVNKNTIFYNSSNSLWENRLIEISDVTNLQSNLNAKEPTINAGTTSEYWRGDKTWQTLNKSAVGLGNVDNTSDLNKPISTATQTALNAKQNNITLTTVGDSGPATLIGSVLNIPEYAQDLSGYVPYVGAVSDLNLGVHRILAQRGYFENNGSNDTLNVIHSSGSGYGINVSKGGSGEALRVNKTSGSGNAASILGGVTLIDELRLNTDLSDSYIASASNWNSAFNDKINSASVTGTTTKTLTLNQQDGGTITASWTDINTDAVSSVFGRVGAVVAVNGDYNTSQVTESSNLYYTEARVNANANVAANTLARHDAVTIGTANGLSLSGQQLSLGLASASSNGALSASDWSTFNNKQNAITNPITGTGTTNYVSKFTGTGSIGDSLIFDNGANVGVGTSSFVYPASGRRVFAINGSTSSLLEFQNGGFINGYIYVSSTLYEQSSAFAPQTFLTSNSERMRITEGGNVGIGTTTPAHKLDVNGSFQTTGDAYFNGTNFYVNSSFLFIGNDATDLVSIGGNTIYLSGNGNVGIGTTAPSQKLEISASNRTLLKLYNTDFDYGANQSKIDFFGKWWSGDPNNENLHASIVGEHGTGDGFRRGVLRFYVNNDGTMINPMMINYSGNVGMGTSAPDPSAILELNSTTQGFLPPRMDNSEINAISNPAEGLIVYSTQSKCLLLFDGANWQKIAYA